MYSVVHTERRTTKVEVCSVYARSQSVKQNVASYSGDKTMSLQRLPPRMATELLFDISRDAGTLSSSWQATFSMPPTATPQRKRARHKTFSMPHTCRPMDCHQGSQLRKGRDLQPPCFLCFPWHAGGGCGCWVCDLFV